MTRPSNGTPLMRKPTSSERNSTIGFNGFEFEPQSGELRDTKSGHITRLRPKSAAVLAVLAARPGTVVSREEIASEVWAGTLIEYDLGVNACIKELRAALRDDANDPTYIETLPRRGYRFAASTDASVSAIGPPWKGKFGARSFALLAAVVAGAVGVWWWFAGPEGRVTVAVLPFETLEPDGQSEYVAAALTADIISNLARADVDRLGVTARTSTNLYRGAAISVAQIGRELNVDYVLEGTLRREEDGFRIALRLIRAPDQSQVWAGEYDRSTSEILHELPTEVATGVLDDLAIEWSLSDAEQFARRPSLPQDSTFRDRYLRARYLLSDPSLRSTKLADSLLTQAVTSNERYAPAWDALADARIRLRDIGGARMAIDRALELAPSNPEALTRRGFVRLMTNFDLDGARRDLLRSVNIGPGLSVTRHMLALFYIAEGDNQAALREGEHALRLDPVSPLVQGDIGWFFVYARRPSDAARHCARATELAPAVLSHSRCSMTALILQNRVDEARSIAADILSLSEFPDSVVAEVRQADAETGITTFWQLTSRSTKSATSASLTERAVAYAQLGQLEPTLGVLEEALTTLTLLELVFLFDHPLLDPVRSAPRFQTIRAASGLPARPEIA